MSPVLLPRLARRLLAVLALCLATDAVAQPALVTPGKLTYGVAATFAPFEFYRDSQLVGFDIEFIQAVGAKLGLEPVPTHMEFRGLIPALQGRRVDIVNSAMYITPARAEQVDFVPYMRIGTQMVVRKGNPSRLAGRGDLCGRKVSVTLGGIQESYARADNEGCKAAGRAEVTVMTFPSAQEAALAVRNGRADAYYESTAGVARITTELADAFEAVGDVFEVGTQIGFAVRQGDTAMAAALARAVREVAADGTYHRLMDKYYLPRIGSLF